MPNDQVSTNTGQHQYDRLQSDENRLVVYEGEYFLVSDQLNSSVMDWDYKAIAAMIIERVNALGKLALDNYTPVSFDAVIWNKSEGRRWLTFQSQSFVYPGPVGARSRERTQEENTFEENCLALLSMYPEVDEAFRLYGREDHDWVTLYRLFEIIQHQAGGSLDKKGWVSKTEISRFSATSQHPDVVGNQSRHGYVPHPASRHPMNLMEARDFIRKLLEGWVRQLNTENPS